MRYYIKIGMLLLQTTWSTPKGVNLTLLKAFLWKKNMGSRNTWSAHIYVYIYICNIYIYICNIYIHYFPYIISYIIYIIFHILFPSYHHSGFDKIYAIFCMAVYIWWRQQAKWKDGNIFGKIQEYREYRGYREYNSGR